MRRLIESAGSADQQRLTHGIFPFHSKALKEIDARLDFGMVSLFPGNQFTRLNLGVYRGQRLVELGRPALEEFHPLPR